MALTALTAFNAILWASVAIVIYSGALVIYRLFFHPLARFPGPKLAATTHWWECYQDIFAGQGGDYINQVEQMHNDYGPVVRVTPDEIHVKDSEWSHVLYAGPGHIRDRDPSLAHTAGTADGTFGTVPHQLHRRRRVPVSTYFSGTNVAEMQGKIWEQAGHMCDSLREQHRVGSVVNGKAAFSAYSNDTMQTCAFGCRLDILADLERALAFAPAFAAFFPIVRQCPWMIPLFMRLPIAPFNYIFPPLATLLTVHKEILEVAEKHHQEYSITNNGEEGKQDVTSYRAKGPHPSLFHALLASDLPAVEKLPQRIAHEGFEIFFAGSDSTARTMWIATYHILANPYIMDRLRKELLDVLPDPQGTVDHKTLENLPWLNSCIKEGLRIGKITDHRNSLIATEEDLKYEQWIIPAGTRVSMTPTRNGYDARFFPDPMRFSPERWLESSEEHLAAMNHVFLPFAAGTRGCLGLHLARAEMHIGLATVFRQFDLELFDTVRERDIDHTWGHISGEPNKNGKPLRFKVVACVA